jgi:hypothetical protein
MVGTTRCCLGKTLSQQCLFRRPANRDDDDDEAMTVLDYLISIVVTVFALLEVSLCGWYHPSPVATVDIITQGSSRTRIFHMIRLKRTNVASFVSNDFFYSLSCNKLGISSFAPIDGMGYITFSLVLHATSCSNATPPKFLQTK